MRKEVSIKFFLGWLKALDGERLNIRTENKVFVEIKIDFEKKESGGFDGREICYDRLAKVIPKRYLSLAYGVNKFSQNYVNGETSQLITFQEKKQKTWRIYLLMLQRMAYQGKLEKCSYQYSILCSWVETAYS